MDTPRSPSSPALTEVRRLGLVEYEDGLRMQEQLVLERQADRIPNQLLLLEHPHVFTLGRRADSSNVLIGRELQKAWGVEVHESVRGGDVTYHGPGQIILYPILQLPIGRQDVVRYVRDMEEVMIRTLADFDIRAGRLEGLSGAWVGPNKLGAIGVRMSKWVTSHGIGVNVNTDLRYFELIIPCGIRDHGVTSISKEKGHRVALETVHTRLLQHMAEIFGLELVERQITMPTIQSIVVRRKSGSLMGKPGLEVLMLHRTPIQGDFWQPVTGRIEAGESPAQAAVREVREETGLTGTLRDLGYVHAFMLDPGVFGAPRFPVPCFAEEHSFVIEVPADATPQLDPATHDAFEWLSLEAAIDRCRWKGNRMGIGLAGERLGDPEREALREGE